MAGFYKDYDAQQSGSSPEAFWSPTRGRSRGPGRHGHEHGRYAGLGLSDEGQEQVEQLFENVARFRGKWKLSDVEFASQLFGSKPHEEQQLKELKEELLSALEHGKKFDQHLWDRHLHFMHKGGVVLPKMRSEFELELCTSHWLDIQLILWTFSVIPAICSRIHSLHLYDTSGGQIASLNHYLRSHRPDCEWSWRGMTWNAYYEGQENEDPLSTDRFVSETHDMWYFGSDNTGDVREESNRKGLTEFLETFGNIHLVTATGELPDSKHASAPTEAQLIANKAQFLLAQITIALGLLSEGGGLILQVDDLTSTHMLHISYVLACCFHELNLYKPATCSSYDRKCYYVCLSYIGADQLPPGFLDKLNRHCSLLSPTCPLFPHDIIPEAFLRQYLEKAGKVVQSQLRALKEVADLFDSMRRRDKELVNMVKTNVVEKVKTFCKLKKISQDKRVIKHVFLDGSPSQLSIARILAPDVFSRKLEISVRSLEAIISSLEQRVKHWSSPEELEEDFYMAVAKKPKVEDKRSFSPSARKFITSQTFWEGEFKLEGSPVDIDPEAVKWLQCPERPPETVSSKRGARVVKILNSPFCPGSLSHKTRIAAGSAFFTNPEKGRKLKDIESLFSASYWYSSGQQRDREVNHFLGKEGLLLASLDLLTDILAPLMSQSTSVYSSTEPVDFLDLSGAPSGFTKYICFRTQDSARGWGVVHSESPVRLKDPEMELYNSWQTFRVLGQLQGMDISKNNTISIICNQLKRECPTGVKLIIGDSSCGRNMEDVHEEELQTKCQFLSMCQVAFQVLAKGGSFVCRVYDLYTRFSVGLFSLLYRSFKQVCVVKPFMSAPSSAERFIVCKEFLGIKPAATKVLQICNDDIHELDSVDNSLDVVEVVPMKVLFEENFFQYILQTNQQFAKRRLAVLSALEHCMENPEGVPDGEGIAKIQNGIFEVLGISEMPSASV